MIDSNYRMKVTPKYDERHNWWYLARGPETFYDENRRLRVWDTKQEAIDWVTANHPELEIIE